MNYANSSNKRTGSNAESPRAAHGHRARDRHRARSSLAALWCAAMLAAAVSYAWAPGAQAATPNLTFAVVAGLPESLSSDTATRALLDTLNETRHPAFIVFDGALRRANETCSDDLFVSRRALLDTSAVPVIVVPGQHDWADCDKRAAGSLDPVERLDFLRQTLFDQPTSLGAQPIHVVRESEVTRFRPYRENARWETADILFVALNVPDGNNRYLNAGGRNGEFEDRAIANAFWLAHAGEYAKRHRLKAIVILIDGDPDFSRFERRGRFAWLGLGRRLPRDGYLEFKRALIELARRFAGPVVLIHGAGRDTSQRLRIDRPLRDDKGELVGNFTRIAIPRAVREPQWLDVRAASERWPMFHVDERTVPHAIRFAAPPRVPGIATPAPGEATPGGGNIVAPAGNAGAASAASNASAVPSDGLWVPGGTTAPSPLGSGTLPASAGAIPGSGTPVPGAGASAGAPATVPASPPVPRTPQDTSSPLATPSAYP